MLTLSRKKNESLIVNNNIEVTILDIKGDQVKIGISAPRKCLSTGKRSICRYRMPTRTPHRWRGLEGLKDLLKKNDQNGLFLFPEVLTSGKIFLKKC